MKIKGILLTLFLSFAGISLVGCGLFDAIKEASAAAAKQTAEKAKKTAGEAKVAAEKEIADNSGADHSVCNEVINEVPGIETEADAAIETAKEAETGTADDVTTANNKANAVKEKADAAKEKAEGCAKEAEPVKATECWTIESNKDVNCTKGNDSVESRVTVYADVEGKTCVKGNFHIYQPAINTEECSSAEDCTGKQDAWIKTQETAGYTCNK